MSESFYRKKPIPVACHQWHKNGDHPEDFSDRNGVQGEGKVVRYFNHPHVSGNVQCRQCTYTMDDHGWIDTLEGGHIVCPGDWIITGVRGERYPCKPDIFAETYEPSGSPTNAELAGVEEYYLDEASGLIKVRPVKDIGRYWHVFADGTGLSVVSELDYLGLKKQCAAEVLKLKADHDHAWATVDTYKGNLEARTKELEAATRELEATAVGVERRDSYIAELEKERDDVVPQLERAAVLLMKAKERLLFWKGIAGTNGLGVQDTCGVCGLIDQFLHEEKTRKTT